MGPHNLEFWLVNRFFSFTRMDFSDSNCLFLQEEVCEFSNIVFESLKNIKVL